MHLVDQRAVNRRKEEAELNKDERARDLKATSTLVWCGMVPLLPLDGNRCDQVVVAGSGTG
jgi:hypothetical protein